MTSPASSGFPAGVVIWTVVATVDGPRPGRVGGDVADRLRAEVVVGQGERLGWR